MHTHRVAAFAFACIAFALGPQPAAAAIDLIPAVGGAPVHLRVSQTISGPTGPQTTTTDLVLRRTGPTTAALQQSTDVSPLVVTSDGFLRLDPSAPAVTFGSLTDLLAALNIAHGVTGVAGAGDRAGWTAQIPVPQRSSPAGMPVPAPSPAAPLMLPLRAIAAGGYGELDIDGSVETSLAPPSEPHHTQRARGGGGFGGFGGMGGRGGFGGSRGGGDSSGDSGSHAGPEPPITLDVHVAGHIAHDALAHLLIAQTRRVVIDGVTYDNVGTWSIDVVR